MVRRSPKGPGLSLRGWRAGLQLALVLRLIVVPLRLRDQAIGTHCPFFVPLDPNGLGSPPGPVFVPVQIHRKIAWLPSPRTSSVFTTMSGNAVMNPWAVAVIAARPTEAVLALTVSEPSSA